MCVCVANSLVVVEQLRSEPESLHAVISSRQVLFLNSLSANPENIVLSILLQDLAHCKSTEKGNAVALPASSSHNVCNNQCCLSQRICICCGQLVVAASCVQAMHQLMPVMCRWSLLPVVYR